MAEKITPRAQDFSKWYHDVILQAQLADYSPTKGCMVMRPRGYALWENIQKHFNLRLQELEVENAYFPLLIPEEFLTKEAQHVEGFAPECATVTHAGGKALEQKYVIRPTSETMINSMFSKWIQSYRDLPIKLNQWANVVRWEKRTRLFLRTTEFLWQEGHTCHASGLEAETFAKTMLQEYITFCKSYLAIPMIAGRKTLSEKFAGAVDTYTIEAMMQDKKALQSGTSHYLGQNFAKAFGTLYLDAQGKQQWVHQTSWGLTTRLIGAMVMVHGDDRGLVLPPYIAPTQVIILPIGKPEDHTKILEAAHTLMLSLKKHGFAAKIEKDLHNPPGWRFHDTELQGIPLRIELGVKELAQDTLMVVRRDQYENEKPIKRAIKTGQLIPYITQTLQEIQEALYEKALTHQKAHIFSVKTQEELFKNIDNLGFFRASWCQNPVCEVYVKETTKATFRCIEIDQDFHPIPHTETCLVCQKHDHNVSVLIARNY